MFSMAIVPKIRIDSSAPTAAVRQIVDQLRVLLVEGALAPGQALPAVRRVAMELGVHFNTVAEAYRQLAEEGWLELSHGRAARVIARTPTLAAAGDRDDFRARMRSLVAEMRSRGLEPPKLAMDLRALAEEMSK